MQYALLIENLRKRGFVPFFADSVEKGRNIVLNLIPKGSVIGFGGSVTVEQTGILDAMKADYTLLHRSLFDASEHEQLFQKMHVADWYIASANAVAETGDIINIDGRGNRVAEMLFGPKNILIICGTNKVVKDINEGIDRARNVAAPKNALRLNKKTPCAYTGECSYCLSPDTMCKATVIHHHPTGDKNFYLVIINDSLGY
ncbi:MAG: lactate utilization protein [Clostridia bacterium]|nr:lactate utilization protein [Clostridia bacterium]